MPTRLGKKKKKGKGPDVATKLPLVTPHSKCRLKLLKYERIKDYLLLEEEFIKNQERLKPQEDRHEVLNITNIHINFFGHKTTVFLI